MHMALNKKNFFQRSAHPYYFRVSEFTHKFAGVRALHYLCHALNEQGYEAWLTDLTPTQCNPWLRTPVLTPEIRENHEKQGLAPIAVYPEPIDGNPLGAPVTARWLLIKPGHDGVAATHLPGELNFYWEADYVPPGMTAERLQIPIIDRRIFNAEGAPTEREGFCYYAHKYILNYSKTLPEVLNDGICLCQWIPRTPEEIADILRSTKVLYCYEPSSMTLEALACGCRVVFVDTPYLEQCGFQAAGNRVREEDIGKIEFPEPDMAHVQAHFDNIENTAWQEIDNFIQKTQTAADAHAHARAAQVKTPEYRLQRAIDDFHGNALEEAAKAFSALLDELPDNPLPAAYLAFLCARQGLVEDAGTFIAQALAVDPQRADLPAALGEILIQAGQAAAAIGHLEHALALRPDLFSAYPALAQALTQQGRQDEAFRLLESAAAIPSDAQAAILGLLLEWRTFQGNIDAIVDTCLRQRANPAHQALAVALLPQAGKAPEQAAAIVDAYVQQHLPPAYIPLPPADAPLLPTAPPGSIRIAFLVSDTRREAAGGRLENLLARLPAARFRTLVLYNDPVAAGSELAQRGPLLDIAHLDDDTALRLLDAQQIDVLVDLDGLGISHRLALFQRAAVAHKFSWSDSALPLAGGIPCLHGAALWPEGETPAGLALLPGVGEILDLPEIPILPRPASSDGSSANPRPFTFACLCAPVHYGSASWRAFARLLAHLPTARLRVNLGELGVEAQAFITEFFAQEGVAAERLDFIRATDRETLAAAWNQTDLGLAPLHGPGDGALPLGLWMNKPWLALVGDAPWSRRPAAWLHALGLAACIAATPDDLPALAESFAADQLPIPDDLRQRIRQQGIGDAQTTVAAFAALIERHCRGATSDHLPESTQPTTFDNGTASQDNAGANADNDAATPFFSIIVPTHHRPELLRRTLTSLRAQDATVAHEIIVVSDAADAGTDQVCHALLRPQDSYLRRNGLPGPAASRNLGLSLARGQYILFLDDDDAWHPDFLAQLHARPEIRQGLPVYFDATRIVEKRLPDGPVTLLEESFEQAGRLTEETYIKNQIPICNHAFPRHLIAGLEFDPHMRAYEDWDFCLAAYRRRWPTHVPVLGPIIFVVHDDSSDRRSDTTGAKGIEAFLDYLYVYRRHPAPDDTLRLQRSMFLDRATGIPIPMECL